MYQTMPKKTSLSNQLNSFTFVDFPYSPLYFYTYLIENVDKKLIQVKKKKYKLNPKKNFFILL